MAEQRTCRPRRHRQTLRTRKGPRRQGTTLCAWETIKDKDLRDRIGNAVSFSRPLRAMNKVFSPAR
uniref:Uncharacterized protein n=1 Tax=Ralstonia phage RSM1 TaxID=384359 RepID=A0JC19_9VIRU